MVSDFHQKSFRIKHEDTNFVSNKLDVSNKLAAIPSFRIYYGDNVPSCVPFIWESQPGTPKHTTLSQTSHYLAPPLTPPPSYFKNYQNNQKPTRIKNSRSKLFHTIIRKFIKPKKPHFSSSSFSWSSSSHSSLSAPATPSSRQRRSCSQGESSYSFDDEVYGKSACGGHQAAYAGVFMIKKALVSVLRARRSS